MTTHDQKVTRHDDEAASAPQAAQPATPDSAAENADGGDDVMRILADVEGQLTRLRTAQKQQDDAIATLTTRSRSMRSAEDDLEKQRLAIKTQQQQIERDQQRLQQERHEFTERCRLTDQEMRKRSEEVDELRRTIEQQRSAMTSEFEQSKRGMAELEHAKTIWQQSRQQVESQLQRAEGEAQQKLAECAKRQEEITVAASQWEKQRQESQAKLEERAREVEARAADLARRDGEMHKEMQRLAGIEQEHQQQRQALERRARVLEDDRGELLKRVEQAERNVGELIEQVERTQQELGESKQHVRDARQKAAAMDKAIESANAKAQKAEHEAQELLRLADSERGDLQKQQEKALRELAEARDAAMAELESARKRIASMQRDLQARNAELTAKDRRLTDAQKKLGVAGQKLTEFAQILSEQTPQLEKGAAALAMVQEQAEQIDRLTKQLAELQLSSDPGEIQRRDKRIDELTDALRQSRGQTADEAAMAHIEQRNATLEREVGQLRLEAQNAQIAADEARKQLQEFVDTGAEQQVKDVSRAEHAAKIAALTAELERVNSVAARDLEEKLSAQSKRYQQELSQARGSEEDATRQLRQRVTELETKLTQAHAQAQAAAASASASGDAGTSEEQAEYLNRLRAKAEQITAVADHLRRRRTRLEKAKRLVREREQRIPSAGAQGSAQMRSDQIEKIERERQHLMEVRKMLATSEYTMIRRWARQRAVFTLASLVMIVAVCAAGSWLVVNHIYPPTRSASVVIEARARSGAPALTEAQRQAWTAWHADVVKDPAFQQALAKRMGERQIERWSRSEAVASRLGKELAVDADDPGVVMYTLTGDDPQEMATFLDVLAGAVLAESNREASHRTDNASAVATGERKEDGRVCFASVNPMPLRDDRLTKGLPTLGISFGVMLVLLVVIYIALVRGKRVFDQDDAQLFGEGAAMAA